MTTGDTGGAVNEDEDHAAEGPSDAEEANAAAWVGLLLVAYDGGDCDVEEEEGGDEFGDESSVEGPELELSDVEEWSWWWVHVVFSVAGLSFFTHFLRHFPSYLLCFLSRFR